MTSAAAPIRYGMFIMPFHPPEKPAAQCYDEDLEQIIAGDVDEVLKRLLQLIEETGTFGTLVLMSYDWDDKQSWLNSMQLFARELMPALNRAVATLAV